MSEVDQLLLAREKKGVRFALVARLGMLGMGALVGGAVLVQHVYWPC